MDKTTHEVGATLNFLSNLVAKKWDDNSEWVLVITLSNCKMSIRTNSE